MQFVCKVVSQNKKTGIHKCHHTLSLVDGCRNTTGRETRRPMVFRNLGLLKLPIEMIYEGGVSYARNPKIQNMLRMVGYGENLGSGFPTILSAWKEARWGQPELKNKIEVDEVELVLPVPNNRNKDASDTINDRLNDRLNDSVMTTYTIISSNPGIQGKDIADISGKSVPTIDRHIAILIKEGLIEHRDSKKTGGYYVK